jgi:hypothetical protein
MNQLPFAAQETISVVAPQRGHSASRSRQPQLHPHAGEIQVAPAALASAVAAAAVAPAAAAARPACGRGHVDLEPERIEVEAGNLGLLRVEDATESAGGA